MNEQRYRLIGLYGLLRDVDKLVDDVSGKSMAGHVSTFWREQVRPYLEHLDKRLSPDPLEEEYFLLGLVPTASDEVVRAAFHAMMKQYHPDIGGGDEEMATKLNLAYEKLAKARGMK